MQYEVRRARFVCQMFMYPAGYPASHVAAIFHMLCLTSCPVSQTPPSVGKDLFQPSRTDIYALKSDNVDIDVHHKTYCVCVDACLQDPCKSHSAGPSTDSHALRAVKNASGSQKV